MQNVQILSRGDNLRSVKTFGNTDADYEIFSSDSDDYDDEDDSYSYEIKSFYIFQSPLCRFIPSGITNYFRNLTILVVAQTGLKSITRTDLKPFKYLRGIYLDKNELEELEEDLFVHNSKIQEVNFSENLLKHIAFNVLEPLKNLKRADFFKNPCIDIGASDDQQIDVLKNVLKEKFEPKSKHVQAENDETLECCKMLYEQ